MSDLVKTTTQKRILEKPFVSYSYGSYNKMDKDQQWIRLTEGCPHNCPYCYEPQEIKVFDIPQIERSVVKIMDMNMLVPSKKPLRILKKLPIHFNGGFIDYEFICGIIFKHCGKCLYSSSIIYYLRYDCARD